jgi:hypothetical protein
MIYSLTYSPGTHYAAGVVQATWDTSTQELHMDLTDIHSRQGQNTATLESNPQEHCWGAGQGTVPEALG